MDRIRKLREEKKMTQLRLGMAIGASQETISGYEIDKAVPPADMLIKLADALSTSVDYLLGRTDDKFFYRINKSDLNNYELELLTHFNNLPNSKKERAIGFIIGLNG